MSGFEQHYATGMALNREQQLRLWDTLHDCGCSDEWLGWYWNKLVSDIGSLKPVEVRTETRDVHHHHDVPRHSSGSSFDAASFVAGEMIGMAIGGGS